MMQPPEMVLEAQIAQLKTYIPGDPREAIARPLIAEAERVSRPLIEPGDAPTNDDRFRAYELSVAIEAMLKYLAA